MLHEMQLQTSPLKYRILCVIESSYVLCATAGIVNVYYDIFLKIARKLLSLLFLARHLFKTETAPSFSVGNRSVPVLYQKLVCFNSL
jgi:hypothetical protein